jgi:NH3-dependent NAD+ synthetase
VEKNLDSKLIIDPTHVKSKIIEFIRSTLEKRDIDGILILYRDCIESITNIHIAIETVGKENVKVLVTKGRFLDKQPREKMGINEINKFLNLPVENIRFINKENTLREIRTLFLEGHDVKIGSIYSDGVPTSLNYNLSYLLLREIATKEIEKKTYAPPMKKPKSRREKFIHETIAHHKSQIRLSVLLAFLLAESENRSFIGSVNKSEWLLGLFTKFGTYHAADFLPLACLYRTQVVQLANHLGLQDYLKSKSFQTPSSYKYFFNLPFKDVDRILIRLESNFSINQIFTDTGISKETIEKVNYYYQASNYARTVPLIPDL